MCGLLESETVLNYGKNYDFGGQFEEYTKKTPIKGLWNKRQSPLFDHETKNDK